MERVIYTNGVGRSITMDYDSTPYILQSITGLTAYEIRPVTRQGYGQHGMTLDALTLGVRPIRITYLVAAESMAGQYAARAAMPGIFSPLAGDGVLTYSNDHATRAITTTVTLAPTELANMGCLRQYEVELTAYDPCWRDVAEYGTRVQDFVGGLRLPLRFNATVRFAMRGQRKVVNLAGDVSSPLRAIFLGGCTNPRISLSTGEYIRINAAIAADERIEINTAYGRKSVDRIAADGTRTSVMDLMDDDSTMLQLQPGKNTVSFAADSGTPEVLLYWYNRYLGV